MHPVVGRSTSRAFSLLELLVVVAVVAVLVSLLLPMLLHARESGYRAVCGSNLRQLNVGWSSYLQNNKDRFPQFGQQPDWTYGGASFVGPDERPVLAADRPINRYLAENSAAGQGTELSAIFRCPSDVGVFRRGDLSRGNPGSSVLTNGSCFREFGTSYRANGMLLNSTLAGLDTLDRPLYLHEIQVDLSRLLLTGDAGWYYASRDDGNAEATLEASWHSTRDAGNMLAADGSTRFVRFGDLDQSNIALEPRPDITGTH